MVLSCPVYLCMHLIQWLIRMTILSYIFVLFRNVTVGSDSLIFDILAIVIINQ